MPTLEETIKKIRRTTLLEADKKLKIHQLKNKKLTTWRGKKIVSLAKISILKRKKNRFEMRNYIPEDLLDGEPPTVEQEFDLVKREWLKDFDDYLWFKKSDILGKLVCTECLLYPFASSRFQCMQKIVLSRLKAKYDLPCNVLNVFKCPYGQDNRESEQILLSYGNMCILATDALEYAITLGTEHHEAVPDSMTFLRNNSDVHHALTDRNTLEAVLEQYLISEEKKDSQKKENYLSIEANRKIKNDTVEFFIGLEIKPEDLVGFY